MLADLGRQLNKAFSSLSSLDPIDPTTLDSTLKSIVAALLTADINVQLVATLRDRVRAEVLPKLVEIAGRTGDQSAGEKGRKVVLEAVFEELVALVDPGQGTTPPFKPVKGKTQVLMLVGLQGAGKTTTCTKKRGLKVALVCADTFRAGAFDQLKQNAAKARVPFFGSYTETDPVAIALEGVTKFRQERFDLIIVDTSGRHRQESDLFEEMVEIGRVVKPDSTIMVLDGAIGQAAEAQSRAFKEASDFGAIIVTKLDGHAKGGGAISAVATTKTPIIFLGTGEHLFDLESFAPRPFISKMLGMGDMEGLMERAKEMRELNPGGQERMREKIEKGGVFTVRDLREQMESIMNMGPLSKLTSMIPGMSGLLGGNEEDVAKKQRRMIFIFDSMTTQELDSDGELFRTPSSFSSIASTSTLIKPGGTKGGKEKEVPKSKEEVLYKEGEAREPNERVLRVARGSGTSVQEVEEVLSQHLMFKGMVGKAGGKSGWMAKMQQNAARAQRAGGAGGMGMPGLPGMGGGGMPDLSKMTPEAMSAMLPPALRAQMSAPGAMEAMQKMMGGMGGGGMGGMMPDLGKLMAGMGMPGGGGAGGTR